MEKDPEAMWNDVSPNPYSTRSGLVLGFHGTDVSVVQDVVLHRQELRPSTNSWDWIGHGIYFWEHSPSRALEFAHAVSLRKNSSIKTPAVLGAVLDLGNCFDLLDFGSLSMVKDAYDYLDVAQKEMLHNASIEGSGSSDRLLRHLDCAVIEKVHATNHLRNLPPFDSVKAVFWEGNLLYPNAGFREKNHIQICIRNPSCIKGLFIPRFKTGSSYT